MNWDAISAIGGVVGTLATVATLIYVAIQIRENTSWIKRQAPETIIDRVEVWGARFHDNPEVLRIYLAGQTDFESFDEGSRHRYHHLMFEILVACGGVRKHDKAKAIKRETVEAIDERILYELRGTGVKAWWSTMGRPRFSSDFADHVDGLVANAARA